MVSKKYKRKSNIFKIFRRAKTAKKKPALYYIKSRTRKKRKTRVFSTKSVWSQLLKIILFIIILVTISVLFRYAYLLIVKIKSNVHDQISIEFVEGLEQVPAYPNSIYLFDGDIEYRKVVSSLVENGVRVYKLPAETAIVDVYDFYKENLPQYGWKYIDFVKVNRNDALYGQYWEKNDVGLRIYTTEEYLWIAKISKQSAENLMATKAKENAENLKILKSAQKQDFLPDYPWRLTMPGDYNLRYYISKVEDYRNVKISAPDTDCSVWIDVIAKYDNQPLDTYLFKKKDQITDLNITKSEVMSTVQSNFAHKFALYSRLDVVTENSNEIPQLFVYTLVNSRNNAVYTFTTQDAKCPILRFIEENIKETPSSY